MGSITDTFGATRPETVSLKEQAGQPPRLAKACPFRAFDPHEIFKDALTTAMAMGKGKDFWLVHSHRNFGLGGELEFSGTDQDLANYNGSRLVDAQPGQSISLCQDANFSRCTFSSDVNRAPPEGLEVVIEQFVRFHIVQANIFRF